MSKYALSMRQRDLESSAKVSIWFIQGSGVFWWKNKIRIQTGFSICWTLDNTPLPLPPPPLVP